MFLESACAKIILFGEHAVVYGRPAIAVPLTQLRARARIAARADTGIVVHVRDQARTFRLEEAADDDPLAVITRLTIESLKVGGDFELWIESDIPLASGLGSGAAVSAAIVRAIAAFGGRVLAAEQVSKLVYETERLYHGSPSGIDNTVIAYEKPMRFTRALGPKLIQISRPFTLVIANTGKSSPTKVSVGDVRRGRELDPARYETIFDEIEMIVDDALKALASGENDSLGGLMTRNQEKLRELDVSSNEIEHLLNAGMHAGAAGGKLSGGGRGGNVIFYVNEDQADNLKERLLGAGATDVIVTQVGGSSNS